MLAVALTLLSAGNLTHGLKVLRDGSVSQQFGRILSA